MLDNLKYDVITQLIDILQSFFPYKSLSILNNHHLKTNLKMHSIFKMQDVLFLIFQMLYTLITEESSGRLGAFAILVTTSSTISEPVLQLLWKKLPSVEPLIDLLPNDLIQRHRNSNGAWKLVSHPIHFVKLSETYALYLM